MTPTIIDLNDAGLRVTQGLNERVTSPGYAVHVDGRVVLGTAARARAWLMPRAMHNRYWHTLDTRPLAGFGKRVRHAGDLAWLHLVHVLEQAGRPRTAIIAVPGHWQRAQLGLLLGIAEAAELGVLALVDAACAAGTTLTPGVYRHIEASLHHSLVTTLEVDDTEVRRTTVEVVAGCGMLALEQRMVGALVAAFLAGCRYDPLSQAATEQALYDHLPEWLAALGRQAEVGLTLEHHGRRYDARIHRDTLAAALAPLFDAVGLRSPGMLTVIDHRLGALPGAARALGATTVLAPDALLQGCLANLEHFNAERATVLRTTLATLAPSARVGAGAARTPDQGSAVSHVLIGSVAHAIDERPLFLNARGAVARTAAADSAFILTRDARGAQLEIMPGQRVLLNGSAVSAPVALAPGDHITLPGAATLFLPITVQADDAH